MYQESRFPKGIYRISFPILISVSQFQGNYYSKFSQMKNFLFPFCSLLSNLFLIPVIMEFRICEAGVHEAEKANLEAARISWPPF